MSISEVASRKPEALVINRPTPELIVKTFDTFPFAPRNWDASFVFDTSFISGVPVGEFLDCLEAFDVIPYTFLTLVFNEDMGKFEPVFDYKILDGDSIGLRQITEDDYTRLEKKPHYFFFQNEDHRAFEVLRREFMAEVLTAGGYVLHDAQIFSGVYGMSDYLSISSTGIGLYGTLGVPLRDTKPIINSERDDVVIKWFKGLKSDPIPTPDPNTITITKA